MRLFIAVLSAKRKGKVRENTDYRYTDNYKLYASLNRCVFRAVFKDVKKS